MNNQPVSKGLYEKPILAFAVLLSTLALLYLVKSYVVAMLLAVVFASVSQPLYKWILNRVNDRPSLASILTLLVLFLAIFLPALILIQLLAVDTLAFLSRVRPIIEQDIELLKAPDIKVPDWMPFRAEITNALPDIKSSATTILSHIATFLLAGAKSATLNTLKFVLQIFIMLYAMFFFLRLEKGGLPLVLSYTGLSKRTQNKLTERIARVSTSTVSGTLVIGLVQGILIGIGLYFAGFSHILYWSSLAAILSMLPAIGVVLIWLPAVIYLAFTGNQGAATGLFLFSAIFTSSADNVLRPILVGRTSNIPDAMILVVTLGGLVTLGASSIILGPIVAGVFLTLWEEYRTLHGPDPA